MDDPKTATNAAGWRPSLLRYGGGQRCRFLDHDQELMGRTRGETSQGLVLAGGWAATPTTSGNDRTVGLPWAGMCLQAQTRE
jgi:hypothetical protein